MSNTSPDIESIVRDFASRIAMLVRTQMSEDISTGLARLTEGRTSTKPARTETPPAAKVATTVAVPGKRKLKLTAKGMAARKLQGQYLGMLRGLRPGARLRVRKMARESGVAEAIKFAGSLK
jgi:hypothetical protein